MKLRPRKPRLFSHAATLQPPKYWPGDPVVSLPPAWERALWDERGERRS
jgi:hypothetical protein